MPIRAAVAAPPRRPRSRVALPKGVTAAEVRGQLERMLASETFERSLRLSAFLRHVVEAGLDGRLAELAETDLAAAVFERRESFDPRIDTIVRVEAGRLRNKVREYYATAGAGDPLWVGLAQRGYRPVVRRRPQRAEARPAREAPGAKTLAVLPIEDLTDGPALALACRALTEELIHGLAQQGDWAVAARTSVRQYRDDPTDVRKIATAVEVAYVLEGSLQKANGTVRLRLRLLDGATGLTLWAGSFDEPSAEPDSSRDALVRAARGAVTEVLGELSGGRR
ncbi:MAG: hypothetical protein GC160_14855 [Acidobacteria bacterium]|nr:hypothetical protein [Acidobacteriota bacterium]